jgi:hypothetical protein
MEPEERVIARQLLGKHVRAAINTQATVEGLLGNGVFCWVRPEDINEDPVARERLVKT